MQGFPRMRLETCMSISEPCCFAQYLSGGCAIAESYTETHSQLLPSENAISFPQHLR
jgi:hypothetical protein